MELPSAVTPPAAKPVAAPAEVIPAKPVVDAAAKPVVDPAAKPVVDPAEKPVVDPAKPAKRKSIADSVGEKVKAALAKEIADKSGVVDPAEKKAAAKAATEKAAAEKKEKAEKPGEKPGEKPLTKPAAKEKDDSDAAIKAEIEVKTKGMDGAAKQAFADLRYEERDLRRQLKELNPKAAKAESLQTELTAVKSQLDLLKKASPTSSVEVEELRAKLEKATARDTERENELMVAKVEKTDAFKNAVTTPKATIDALAKKLANKYQLAEGTILAALHDTSDKQSDLLIAAVEGMNDIEKQQLFNAAVKLQDINEKAEVLRSQAKEAMEKIDAKRATETGKETAAQKAERDAAHSTNWKALAESLPSILTPAEGDDEVTVAWNAAQTGAETFAKDTDYGTLKPDMQSQVMQRASVFPLLVGALTSAETQLAESQAAHAADLEELTKFRAKVPGGGADHQADDTTDPAAGKKGFVERTSARFAAAGFA